MYVRNVVQGERNATTSNTGQVYSVYKMHNGHNFRQDVASSIRGTYPRLQWSFVSASLTFKDYL